MESEFVKVIKSEDFSQECARYKWVAWTNINWDVVMIFHAEVQLNTISVLCLSDRAVVRPVEKQWPGFVCKALEQLIHWVPRAFKALGLSHESLSVFTSCDLFSKDLPRIRLLYDLIEN